MLLGKSPFLISNFDKERLKASYFMGMDQGDKYIKAVICHLSPSTTDCYFAVDYTKVTQNIENIGIWYSQLERGFYSKEVDFTIRGRGQIYNNLQLLEYLPSIYFKDINFEVTTDFEDKLKLDCLDLQIKYDSTFLNSNYGLSFKLALSLAVENLDIVKNKSLFK